MRYKIGLNVTKYSRLEGERRAPDRRIATFVALALAILFGSMLPPVAKAQATSAADLAGTWKGELGQGAAKLHIVLTITKSSDGAFSGQLNSVDQGSVIPMENVTLKGDAVRFEVKAVGGVYEGTLNTARTEFAGSWTQGGAAAQPIKFVRSTEDASQKDAAQKPVEGPKEKPISTFVDVIVPIAPTAFKADGKWHLVYELHLNNMDRWDTN